MLTEHTNKYMIHINECEDYLKYFKDCEYYAYDSETCCTTQKVYNDYYVDKVKCKEKGAHAKTYAWALSNTSNDYVIYGENLNQFLKLINMIFEYRLPKGDTITATKKKGINKLSNITIAVHNLKFDIEFIKYELFKQHFKYYNSIITNNRVTGKTESSKCFNIIENDGNVYGANIYLSPKTYNYTSRKENRIEEIIVIPHIEMFDTFKIMSQSLDDIGKNVIKIDEMFYKMSEEYDYNLVRENGHKLTQLEKNYLYNDVYILKEFLIQFYMPIGTTAKTASAIAYKEFLKQTWGKNSIFEFNKLFPSTYDNPQIAEMIKKSYKGGWTFAERHYLGKHMKDINGTSIDINSSYPSQMYNRPLPYGKPHLYNGEVFIDIDEVAILEVQFDSFYNKDSNDYFGFMQANECNLTGEYGYCGTDYVYSNIFDGEFTGYTDDLTGTDIRDFKKYLWNFELDNILEHTVLTNMVITKTIVFKAKTGIFNKAIDHFMNMKIEGKKTGNKCIELYAKMILNSFYGKMASKVDRCERTLILNNGLAMFKDADIFYETDNKYYPSFASAVTAWGRCTLRDALYKLCINDDGTFSPNVLYCDTDSIYSLLPVEEVKRRMSDSLHPTFLGKWDIEKQYKEFKAIGSKKYMLTTNDGEIICKCAGLPKEAREIVTYNTFYLGASFDGKKASKHVPGGTLIVPTDFKLKITSFNI